MVNCLSIIAAKAARLRILFKKASDPNDKTVGVLQTLGGMGLLGTAGEWGKNIYNRIAPSFAQLAERTWTDPEQAKLFEKVFNRGGQSELKSTLDRDPTLIRRALLGEKTPLSDKQVSFVRDTLVGDGSHGWPATGDVVLHAPGSELTSTLGRRANILSGNTLNHASIVGPGGQVFTFAADPRGRGVVDKNPFVNYRLYDDNAYVRYRDTSLTPQQVEQLNEVVPQTYNRKVSGGGKPGGKEVAKSVPFDFRKETDLGLREVIPELARGDRSALSPILDRLSGNRTVGRVVKKLFGEETYKNLLGYRRLGARCGPGEVCSTMAGRALENVGAPVAKEMTPGDITRNAKRFKAQGVYLPQELRNSGFLRRQHLRRMGPAAIRAPIVGAMGLGGLYLAGSGVNRLASSPQTGTPTPVLSPPVTPTQPPSLDQLPVSPTESHPIDARLGVNHNIFRRAAQGTKDLFNRFTNRHGSET